MRVVVALGGNALLRRGEPLSAENQRQNVARACHALAPDRACARARRRPRERPPGRPARVAGRRRTRRSTRYPLDVLDAETQGMIGYLIMQELGNQLPVQTPLSTLLTMIEVDPADPAFENPTKPIGPIYTRGRGGARSRRKGWTFKPGRGQHASRRAVAAAASGSFGLDAVTWLLEHGSVVDLRRRRRDPDRLQRGGGSRRPSAGRRRGRDRQGPRKRRRSRPTSVLTRF